MACLSSCSDVDEVVDAMDYAVYVYDVQHIILDNLQFMMTGVGKGYEKFDMQERALDKFRKVRVVVLPLLLE